MYAIMRAVNLLVSCIFGCMLPTLAFGQMSYYEVYISGDTGYADGYANLDWSNPSDLHGELCLTVWNKVKKTAKFTLRGTNPRAGVLALTIPKIAPLKLAAQPLVFSMERDFLFDYNKHIPSWMHAALGKNDSRIDLIRIPKHIDPSFKLGGERDRFYFIGALGQKESSKFQLSNYDSLTKEQVLALEAKNAPQVYDGGYEPGEVRAVVARTRLDDLRRFLTAEGGGAAFEDPSYDACGAPFVMLDISVPPLLELYYSRKLQVSGLVVTAYPNAIGAGIGFDSFGIHDKQIVQLISSSGVALEQKDRQLWNTILGNVRAFVEARRPDFRQRGTIARLQRGGGQVLVYRVEIVGPALSECTREVWEKLVLQVIPQPTHIPDELQLLFQFQEGFFAPGSLDRRPDDARMNENRIPDGRLEGLQERLYGFLVTRGFSNDESAPINSEVACKL